MSNEAWETLSNQAIGAAGIVYFLALLVHLAEWASLRKPKVDVVPEVSSTSRLASSHLSTSQAGARTSTTGTPSVVEVRGAQAPSLETSDSQGHRAEFFGRVGLLLTMIAAGAHVIALVGRGMAATPNRVPWGNMYEFTISGTFVVALMYLVLYKKFRLHWMAPLVVGFVLTTLMVAVIWLYKPVAPLMDSLQSYWLVIHVVSAIIATGAFTIGGIASIVYLVKKRAEGRLGEGEQLGGWLGRVPTLDALDKLAYRVHAFAFPVWTFAVLITGPIWAHEAWSRYWNWDPKEVWAFITWVVYAGYLHARATAGWKGRNAAILALVGLATLWFNFIGVNFFAGNSSQHSYALERPLDAAHPPNGT